MAVREIRSEDIGRLVKVRGIVTRVSEVKPLLMVNAYSCDLCGSEVFQEISSKQFLPLTECPSMECRRNNTKGRLFMQTRASRFVRFQQLKIQELVLFLTTNPNSSNSLIKYPWDISPVP